MLYGGAWSTVGRKGMHCTLYMAGGLKSYIANEKGADSYVTAYYTPVVTHNVAYFQLGAVSRE